MGDATTTETLCDDGGEGAKREIEIRSWRRPPVAERALVEVIDKTLDLCDVGPASVGVKLTTDRVMQRLNRRYRGIDSSTDVLSFEGDAEASERPHLGDLVISLETAARQADRSGLELERELSELLIHGLLHLLGHDHGRDDRRMERLELSLRERVLDRRRGQRPC